MTDYKIPVVIPYFAREAQGDELELAVTGWRRHFKYPHEIVIVGDRHPIITTGDDITFIECPRVVYAPGNYLPHIDHVQKFLLAAMMKEEIQRGFIYTCDDIYPVNDFSLVHVMIPKISERVMSADDADCTTGWWGDYQKTRRKCIEENLATMNWVCHLPVFYDWDHLMDIYEEYGCHKTSYIVENLYFNTYYRNFIPILVDGSDIFKYEVSRDPLDEEGLMQAFKSKIWVTNTPGGWSRKLEQALRNHYKNQ